MESGKIDALAFIGGSNAADRLIKYHPHPHRLKIFLQLEAKNMAIMHKNLFDNSSQDDGSDDLYNLEKALDDVITGALSFNGQRCTALKIIMVPEGKGEHVAKELSKRVQSLRIGLPWQTFGDDNSLYSQITPLPTDDRIAVMNAFIEDALSKGSSIINPNGGTTLDLADPASSSVISKSNLMVPTVLFPVKPDMELYREEQFGPIIPVTEYNPATFEEVLTFAHEGKYGQQVSIFTKSNSNDEITFLVDQLSPVFGKINLNSQCGRSPDILPFSARKSSGLGVMSVEDALREFSIPTVVAFKTGKDSRIQSTVEEIQDKSNFMKSIKR
jgi:glyceraldehyde-3-phosphate dehydrogenase (NADP+)